MSWNFIASLSRRADEYFHISELEQFFLWLREHGEPSNTETILIDLPLQREFLSAYSGVRIRTPRTPPSFIVTRPTRLPQSIQSYGGNPNELARWTCLFFSSQIEIWESQDRHKDTLPLRFGLSTDEAALAITIARVSIEQSLGCEQTPLPTFPKRFSEPATVDVALYVGGTLRGSIIVENMPFGEAIAEAARRASCDPRKKRLSAHELSQTAITISWISNLRIAVTNNDFVSGFIDGRRGYETRVNNERYWLLPSIFNEEHFIGMSDLRDRFFETKVGIPRNRASAFPLRSFLTHGYLGLPNARDTYVLDGPVPVVHSKNSRSHLGEHNGTVELHDCGKRAASWLLAMQEEDGYLPLFFDPIYGRSGRSDPVRMSCTLHTLGYYALATNDDAVRNAAKRLLRYLTNALADGAIRISPMNYSLAYAYLARASIALGAQGEALRFAALSESFLASAHYEPLYYGNLASMYAELGTNSVFTHGVKKGAEIAETCFNDFLKRIQKKEHINLVSFAELAHAYVALWRASGNHAYRERARRVALLLKEPMMPNGAIPVARDIPHVLTRGCGKIFEVLASDPKEHTDALVAIFSWLKKLQFEETHGYCFPPERTARLIGGFRHDYANPEAWIDGAGHVLLGIARLLLRQDFAQEENPPAP